MAKMKEYLHYLKVLKESETKMPDQLIKKLLIMQKHELLKPMKFIVADNKLYTKEAFLADNFGKEKKPDYVEICSLSAVCFFKEVRTLKDVFGDII